MVLIISFYSLHTLFYHTAYLHETCIVKYISIIWRNDSITFISRSHTAAIHEIYTLGRKEIYIEEKIFTMLNRPYIYQNFFLASVIPGLPDLLRRLGSISFSERWYLFPPRISFISSLVSSLASPTFPLNTVGWGLQALHGMFPHTIKYGINVLMSIPGQPASVISLS